VPALILWFVLGGLCAAFLAFILSHFTRGTLRALGIGCLGGYVALFAALVLVPDADRARFVGPLAWCFSTQGTSWKALLAGYGAFALAVAWFVPRYQALGLGPQQGTLRHLVFPFRAMALTFDDGPSPAWTPKVLELLERHKVRATFFMVGESVERYPELVKAVAAARHTIGCHSYGHRPLPLLRTADLKSDLDRADKAFEAVLGARPNYFRPPWGFFNRPVLEELRSRGYLTVLWTRSSQDWRNPGVDRIVDLATRNPALGEIVLLHDAENFPRREGDPGRQQTLDALDRLIPLMERQGFQFKTLDEMVQAWLS